MLNGYNKIYQSENKKIQQIMKEIKNNNKIKLWKNFNFPLKQELKLRLKDLLEENVDEKYYLSDKLIKCFNSDGTGKYPRGERFRQNIGSGTRDIANTLITSEGTKASCNFVIENNDKIVTIGILPEQDRPAGNYLPRERVIDSNSISRAITTSESQMPYYSDYSMQKTYNSINKEQDINKTITANSSNFTSARIRRLTETEMWRLMGFEDSDILKAKNVGISRTQLIKQAGNSIVVNVLEALFKELFKGDLKG